MTVLPKPKHVATLLKQNNFSNYSVAMSEYLSLFVFLLLIQITQIKCGSKNVRLNAEIVVKLGTFSSRTYTNKSANEVFLLYWFQYMNMKMEVKMFYENSLQTYRPSLFSNSVRYRFSTKPCDCLKVTRHTRSQELHPLVRL